MKYYLVDYLIFENSRIIENNSIGLLMHGIAGLNEFKSSIAKMKDRANKPETVIIKNHKQVSAEEFNSLTRG